VSAVTAHDELGDTTISITTSAVVNATGVWADDLFTIAEHKTSHRITPAKGRPPQRRARPSTADVAAVLSVPGDRRSIFVVPFEGAAFTYIGTTDTHYEGEFDEPHCTPRTSTTYSTP